LRTSESLKVPEIFKFLRVLLGEDPGGPLIVYKAQHGPLPLLSIMPAEVSAAEALGAA
jgi:hypothetical protein